MLNTILVVDDELDLVYLYRLVLEMNGYRVRTATSGSQALRIFEEDPPDLVLLDVMMPEMDGIEVCRRLRSRYPADGRQPVIMMYTANDSEENRHASLAAGADEFFSKDIPVDAVTAKISSCLMAASEARPPFA